MQKTLAQVYVNIRKVNNDENSRKLWFILPPTVPVREFLTNGLAVDGNQVLGAVMQVQEDEVGETCNYFVAPFGVRSSSLAEALAACELSLLELLEQHGYQAVFS